MGKKHTDEEFEALVNTDPLVIQMRRLIISTTQLLGESYAEIIKKNLADYIKKTYGK